MKLFFRLKPKDCLAVLLALILVLTTILLVIDLQLELGWTTGVHLYEKNYADGRQDAHFVIASDHQGILNNFQRKFRNSLTTETSKLTGAISIGAPMHGKTTSTMPEQPSEILRKIKANDKFNDLMELTAKSMLKSSQSEKYEKVIVPPSTFAEMDILDAKDLLVDVNTNGSTSLDRFHQQINRYEMYSEKSDILVSNLLHDMAKHAIKHVEQKVGGTQLKLVVKYDNSMMALFKPMRFPREQQTLPNHFYFSDYERHTAEIAAFHLDRVLGFRRAMPVTGRILNITTEIFQVAPVDLMRTSFVSPANNLCFHGKCSYYCDTGHAICGQPDTLEGSLAAFLPISERKPWRHPWRRSYNKHKKARWETDAGYCDTVKEIAPYNEGRRLLDLMDMSVFDFLMGNMDRHHYETFHNFGNQTFTIHLDHGRGFGKPFHDEISILAPVLQCCRIRASTLKTLLDFHNGPMPLSDALRKAMSNDPIAPVLWEPHLKALDRRIMILLSGIRDCIDKIDSSDIEEGSEPDAAQIAFTSDTSNELNG